MSCNSSMFGDRIQVNVSIAANVPDSHAFKIGSTIRHISTNQDFDLPLQSKTNQGERFFQPSFDWIIPSNAPLGAYSVIIAVWENASAGIPSGRLDDETIPNAFNLE